MTFISFAFLFLELFNTILLHNNLYVCMSVYQVWTSLEMANLMNIPSEIHRQIRGNVL